MTAPPCLASYKKWAFIFLAMLALAILLWTDFEVSMLHAETLSDRS